MVAQTSGVDSNTNTALLNCAWEKDYFTSARPWEQKGPSITIPLGTAAPLSGIALSNTTNYNQPSTGYTPAGGQSGAGSNWSQGEASIKWRGDTATHVPDIFADLSGASAVTINVLREAMALQRYEEARARFGLGMSSIFVISVFGRLTLVCSVLSIWVVAAKRSSFRRCWLQLRPVLLRW